MNKEWARERLNAYLDALREYQRHIDGHLGFNRPAYERAIALEPAAKAIMRQINPEYLDYELVQSASTRAITFAIQTLALVDQAEEIEANLAPPSPQLSASALHPWVWGAAASLWETRHYREAVQAAATSVNAHLQALVGRRDISDYKLITELFSEKDPEVGKTRLRWPGDATDEEFKSMQAGLRSFGSGVFQAIRNRTTHDLTELTEQEALERLAAMSLLCHWIQSCRIMSVD